jgi:DNA repair protein RecO (recombination protein O)
VAILKTEGIVLRVMDYSETSLIAWFATREHGRVHVLAKGARRPRSTFEGALEPLVRGELVFYRKKRSSDGLDIAKEFDPTDRHVGLRRDLGRLYRGLYAAELLAELSEREAVNPGMYDAAARALRDLASGEPATLDATLLSAELALLREAGLAPALDGCVRCGGAAAEPGEACFSAAAGGLLCGRHAQGEPSARRVAPGALKTLQALARGQQVSVGRELFGLARDLLDGFVAHHLGKRLRLRDYLRSSAQAPRRRPARQGGRRG